jgi:hypothetical protein
MRYAVIRENNVSEETRKVALMALASARKEMRLPPIQIKWFTYPEYAKDPIGTFEYEDRIQGLFRIAEPDTICVMATQMDDGIKRAVFHECTHLAHWLKGNGFGDIDSAEKFAEECAAYMRRLSAIDRDREEEAYFDYLMGRDKDWASPENAKAMRHYLEKNNPIAPKPTTSPSVHSGGPPVGWEPDSGVRRKPGSIARY